MANAGIEHPASDEEGAGKGITLSAAQVVPVFFTHAASLAECLRHSAAFAPRAFAPETAVFAPRAFAPFASHTLCQSRAWVRG